MIGKTISTMDNLLPVEYPARLQNLLDCCASETEPDDGPLCACYEYAGDNPRCPVHGKQVGPDWTPVAFAAGEDPRTPEQIDLDQWQQEARDTYNSILP